MNTSHQPTRYSVDAVALKFQVEANLGILKAIKKQHEEQLDAWYLTMLTEVIASHELQLAQLNEDLLINKII